ncbi:MAG: class I SAM-dependent methyltransferase [Actinomycetota bacterium]|nr:class I SAM-dependent methyltransferase [Actinomycetota bacterium]
MGDSVERNKAKNIAPAPRFTEGDVAAPALPVGSFDVVLSRHVLWAMPDPQPQF